MNSFGQGRFKASGIHLGISLVIALLAAALVFGLWYPYPYREISGGRELFLLVVVVDVILGPLITLAVFNRGNWGQIPINGLLSQTLTKLHFTLDPALTN